ncbi:MAG: hypothetical protein IKL88_08525 [Erysipelotrichales bacterium]|nr:hypothetical protein [Erysipelotrichales bacterium]
MKINNNSEMQAFFERCFFHMGNEEINDYIGVTFLPEQEKELQYELAEVGAIEFQGPESEWPSLYISTEEYLKTAYQSHIQLDQIKSDTFEFRKQTMPPYTLFNVSVIQEDPNRELNDSLMLRALDAPYEAAVLLQDGEYWMSDTPQEANTIDPFAKKAHGKVAVFGLGIGYFVYNALLNPNVEKVCVVEYSQEVIDMFTKYLLPQFPRGGDVEIIHGDAFDYFNEEFLSKYDYCFTDIWKSNGDGFEMIQRMLEGYLPEHEKVDFWIESTCCNFISSMMCVYFHSLANDMELEHEDPELQKIYHKIDQYFSAKDITVEDHSVLQEYMYDPYVIREILAINI